MPVYERCRMCPECPFRKISPRGWLGPWTVEDMEQIVHFEQHLICHLDVTTQQNAGLTDEQITLSGQHCVGALRYMSSVGKLSREPEKAQAQKKLKQVPDQSTIEPFKLREHHSVFGLKRESVIVAGPGKRKKTKRKKKS